MSSTTETQKQKKCVYCEEMNAGKLTIEHLDPPPKKVNGLWICAWCFEEEGCDECCSPSDECVCSDDESDKEDEEKCSFCGGNKIGYSGCENYENVMLTGNNICCTVRL